MLSALYEGLVSILWPPACSELFSTCAVLLGPGVEVSMFYWCCWDRTEIVVVVEVGLVFPSSALIRGVGAIHLLSEVVRNAISRSANDVLGRDGQCLATCPAVQCARYVSSSLGTLVTYCRMFRSFQSGILPVCSRFIFIHVTKPREGFCAHRIAMHSNYCHLYSCNEGQRDALFLEFI
jgi:hypothetical protein